MRFEHFEINLEGRDLLIDKQSVAIGARAFDVLVALAKRHSQIISKHDLMEMVWPHAVVEENNLQVQISTLRKLLGTHTISTIPGRGYCFTVQPLSSPQAQSVSDPDFAHTQITSPTPSKKNLGNMPANVPKLWGRHDDLVALETMLAQHRCVTVTGSGGVGKTLLVKTLANKQQGDWAGGVWWLDATTVHDTQTMTNLIAQTLDIGLNNEGTALTELGQALHSQEMLLVLDNCERVLAAAKQVVQTLLNVAPRIQVLATSQARLQVKGEFVYQLSTLRVPDAHTPLAQAQHFGAIALFTERVQQLDRHFHLEADSLPDAIAICQQLEGVALSIELAAARVPLLGVRGVYERLGERLRLLGNVPKGAQAYHRHATMRTALDWSHQLLDAPAACVFRRLSVFVGSFSLEVAKHLLCDEDLDEWEMLELLESLIDRSLVMVAEEGTVRYRLLETHRAYALEQLEAAGETALLQQKLSKTMVSLGWKWVKARATQKLWSEINHIRAAYDWAMQQQDEANHQTAIALATCTAMLLLTSGYASEALARLLAVEHWVNDQTPASMAARYWQWLGRSGVHGRLATSRCVAALAKSEKLFQAMQDWRHVHACIRMRAEALVDNHQLAQAKVALLKAQAMELPDWPVADRMRRIKVQALLCSQEGQDHSALRLVKEALAMAEVAGISRYVMALQLDLANLHLKMGSYEVALALYSAMTNQPDDLPYHRITLAEAYAGYMTALMHQGDYVGAASVGLRGLPRWQTSGIFLKHGDLFAWWLAQAKQALAAAQMLGATDFFFATREVMRDVVAQHNRARSMQLLAEQVPADSLVLWITVAEAQAKVHIDEEALARELERQWRRSIAPSALAVAD